MTDAFVENFDQSLAAAFGALVRATKAAGRLPADVAFHRTLDETVDRRLARTGERVLHAANALWMQGRGDPAAHAIAGVDDVAVTHDGAWQTAPGFRAVVDAVDTLLERIDVGLDAVLKTDAHRHRTSAAAKRVGAQSAPLVTTVPGARGDFRLVHAQNMPRPQLAFADAVDNSPSTPFVWKLRSKPHARVPLDHGLPSAAVAATPLGRHLHALGIARPDGVTPPGSGAATPVSGDAGLAALPHPYEFEIRNHEPPAWLLDSVVPQEPRAWDATPFAFVDTRAQLDAMLAHLDTAREVAIDLEHHDYRSFQGFTCLVQLSTRTHDFVVDALALRADLHELNAITADPARLKVFHGAESDIVWLQRDFGVYVVGMFDTYHASHVLNMPHHSLAHLLAEYCGVRADKRLQLADWRIRPLPAEMLAYARSDTHYLLYVCDRMRAELLERGARLVGTSLADPDAAHFGELAGIDHVTSALQPLELVLARSQATALKTHVKEGYDAEHGLGAGGWARLLRKWRHALAPAQLAVFRALHQWRDCVARDEDESVRYVLPNHMLFTLASKMPAEPAPLLAACQPTPPLLRLHAADVARLIARARARADARQAEFRDLAQAAHDEAMPPPVHTRFADQDEPPAQLSAEPAADVLTDELLRAAQSLAKPHATLFGSAPHPAPVPAASPAAERARQIRAGLVLTVAAPIRVISGAAEPEFTLVTAKRAKPAPAAAAVAPKPAVILSESFQSPPTRAAPPAAAKRKSTTEALDLSAIDLSDHESRKSPEARKPPKPRKRTRTQSSKEPAPSAADVEAYDYRHDAVDDAIGETRAPQPSKKSKKKKANFDPYAAKDTFDKRPNRSRVNNKSGNRSLSYKKA
ncbi:exosome nuclease subunit [Coemansia sp. RSA 2611]|nr:exosome nuclease subunit [Coemansia sp. RSA 2704]KAJ2392989.1 exosome nuclease subunit [Coemansia sp. RSA 2611]